MSRRLIALVAVIGALALLTGAPASGAFQNYWNGAMLSHSYGVSGYNNWVTNKLWRPIGYQFSLWFENSANPQAGFNTNSSNNLFAIYGPYGYSRGYCYNATIYTVGPVTCNMYTYVP